MKKAILFGACLGQFFTANGAESEKLSEARKSDLSEGSYLIQKQICSKIIAMKSADDLTAIEIADLNLLESLIYKITDTPVDYCQDVALYRPGQDRVTEGEDEPN